MVATYVYQVKRGTAAEWAAADPILADGEWGLETDSEPRRLKIGDGVSRWSALEYAVQSALTDEEKAALQAFLQIGGLSGVEVTPDDGGSSVTLGTIAGSTNMLRAVSTATIAGRDEPGNGPMTALSPSQVNFLLPEASATSKGLMPPEHFNTINNIDITIDDKITEYLVLLGLSVPDGNYLTIGDDQFLTIGPDEFLVIGSN